MGYFVSVMGIHILVWGLRVIRMGSTGTGRRVFACGTVALGCTRMLGTVGAILLPVGIARSGVCVTSGSAVSVAGTFVWLPFLGSGGGMDAFVCSACARVVGRRRRVAFVQVQARV